MTFISYQMLLMLETVSKSADQEKFSNIFGHIPGQVWDSLLPVLFDKITFTQFESKNMPNVLVTCKF